MFQKLIILAAAAAFGAFLGAQLGAAFLTDLMPADGLAAIGQAVLAGAVVGGIGLGFVAWRYT